MYGNAIRIMVPLTVEDEVLQEGLDIIKGILTAQSVNLKNESLSLG